ncbi:MAG: fatty acid desaturase [Bdellovibrionales bacterium]|nr:fatty acid desaturase [Bdellovibrionales bacterium]
MKTISKPIYNLRTLYWPTTLFLLGLPLLALILTPIYFALQIPSWGILISAIVYMFFLNFCITAGYHRYYSHRTFQAKPWLQWVWLIFGAGAFQMSALKWCSDHRRHHKNVDTNDDPYSIAKGSFYAHMGWILLKDSEIYKNKFAADLEKNKRVSWQHRNYYWLAILMSFGVPTLWGWALGDALGGFLIIGVWRQLINWHITFFVNSVCHMWGSQPYSLKHSAKDNFIVALLAVGEGYHNFHHTFEGDYRNGVKWYNWDPTKWAIRSLSLAGQTYKLRRTSKEAILRSRLQADQERLSVRGVNTEALTRVQTQIEGVMSKINELKKDYDLLKTEYRKKAADWEQTRKEKILHLKAELELAKIELRNRLNQWSRYVDIMSAAPTYT